MINFTSKVYIQCPYCDCFVARSVYDVVRHTFTCDSCGTFTLQEYKESGNDLVCIEISYAAPGSKLLNPKLKRQKSMKERVIRELPAKGKPERVVRRSAKDVVADLQQCQHKWISDYSQDIRRWHVD